MTEVAIVGAGVSGLACALELQEAGVDVVLLEAGRQAGGAVHTLELDGYRFETGASTIQSNARTFRNLCGRLGIADRLIVSKAAAQTRYLFHRGELVRIPTSPREFLTSPLVSFGSKLRALTEPLRKHAHVPDDAEEPSVEEFLEERIGYQATRTLGAAFVRGVYAAEVDELGVRSAFPRVWALANEHGGLLRGLRAERRARENGSVENVPLQGPRSAPGDLLSFPTGLCELPDALARAVGPALRLESSVESLERVQEGFILRTHGGGRIDARQVVLAVPAPAVVHLAKWLKRLDLDRLRAIEHAAVTLVSLGLRGSPLPPGLGVLVPPDEIAEDPDRTPQALGILFPSNIFPGRAPEGGSAVTCVYRTSDLSVGDPAATAKNDIRLAIGERPEVVTSHVHVWRDVIPRYGVGHSRALEALRIGCLRSAQGLHLAGSYTGGVSVEDCLARGRQVARDVVDRMQGRPAADNVA